MKKGCLGQRGDVARYLDVLVALPELHQLMVRSHGFAELADVGADGDVVLPDLPVLKVTPEGFSKAVKGLIPAGKTNSHL